MPPKRGTKKKAQAAKVEVPVDEEMQDVESSTQPEKEMSQPPTTAVAAEESANEESVASGAEGPSAKKLVLTPQERAAKLEALRERMRASAIANRRDLIEESNRAKHNAKELARLERKRKLAETLREKIEAQETGEDLERKRNWEYSIEEDQNWAEKMEKKARNADFEFHDYDSTAHRKYEKDLDLLRPDLITYNQDKERALGLEPGTLVTVDETGRAVLTAAALDRGTMTSGASASGTNAEVLYRDANSLSYADNKPSEEAIDRVVNKLNNDLDKRGKWSRKRANEDEGDVTYINQRNKVFNKKIARFYDKYTTEIRDSFERGTAV
ncbi:hypothetical protein PIIN_06585 [Serendipita indica DSM 11827]|uniref:Pre-mRNA-splicing factor SYF2 n=1 Tax=Serendipita indica (strain DSM 11827) TaxID=1109443 RepID=G4TMV7_SERID|nr:hypothetical protein PIIN_06585 [Serendipita indica DSM 11827]